SGQGRAFVAWYDWRDAPAGRCGGVSNVYIARSEDGGGSWTELKETTQSVTNTSSDWTNSSSFLAPNQGDYLNLFATDTGVHAAWAAVRTGDRDVSASYITPHAPPFAPSLVSAIAIPDRVTLPWFAPDASALLATVYRRSDSSDWTAIGQLDVAASG